MSELIDSASGLGEENWPSMRRIVFSQIKDNTSFETLEESICQGMDVYHRRENFDFMFSDTESIPPGEKIILIDSLDEHPNRADWWNVTKKLSNEGWKVIWSCRDPDWRFTGYLRKSLRSSNMICKMVVIILGNETFLHGIWITKIRQGTRYSRAN